MSVVQTYIPPSVPKKFRVVQALIIGGNAIVHNLAFSPTFAAQVEVRDDTTGQLISARVTSETTNAVVIDVGAPVAAARITVT